MKDNLIILAGGASSRMKKSLGGSNISQDEKSQANQRSKALISVGPSGRPILDYLLLNAKEAGYKKVYIIIGEKGELFKEFYGEKDKDNDFNGLKISFAIQYIPEDREKPFGTADALFQALEQYSELIDQSFTVCNSDNLYSTKVLKELRITKARNAFISYDRDALEFTEDRIARFALTQLDQDGNLMSIIEKPALSEVENYRGTDGKLRVSMNVFKFTGEDMYPFLRDCPINKERNEKEIPTALLNLVEEKPKSVLGIPFSEHVPDLTSKEDIAIVKKYLTNKY